MLYQTISDIGVQQKVRKRYRNSIAELESVGFSELAMCSEQMFPMSALLMVPFVLPMLKNKEVLCVGQGVRLSVCFPVMHHKRHSTYAAIFGLGVKFYTAFQGGAVLLVSGNTGGAVPAREDDSKQFYKYSVEGVSVTQAWEEHLSHMGRFAAKGQKPFSENQFSHFAQMSQREDQTLGL